MSRAWKEGDKVALGTGDHIRESVNFVNPDTIISARM